MTVTTVTTGNTRMAQLIMTGGDSLTVQTGAFFDTANPLVLFNTSQATQATVNNDGSMTSTGRAFRFESSTGPLNVVINNTDNGIIQTGNDGLQLNDAASSGTLVINNSGLWESTGTGQAVDAANGTGALIVTINNLSGGVFGAQQNDGLRVGSGVGNVNNSHTIVGGASVAIFTIEADGIEYEDNATGTVNNLFGGEISGDRHGINAGAGSLIVVNNDIGSTITGHNGSGVGSDGSATVVNDGIITGSFANNIGSDQHSLNAPGVLDGTPDGDGDGIDIDQLATITNNGTIEGTGAGGHGSDGQPNTAEAIAAGGGTITNGDNGIITGQRGILIDNSSGGNAFFQTTINNDGTILGNAFYAIKIVSTFNDTITNTDTITGTGGTAILFGAGNNTLNIGFGSVINGLTDGEGGTNTIDYLNFAFGTVTVNLTTGAATGTGGLANFQNASGSSGADNLTGSNGVNTLIGRGGSDVLNGGLGMDSLQGGADNDIYVLGAEFQGTDAVTDTGGIDTITSTITRSLLFADYSEIENLTLLGNTVGMVGTGTLGANRLDSWMSPVANTLRGLNGNDIYYIGAGDIVDEVIAGSGGTDTVYSNASYTLAANLENLYLFGTTPGINGNGNALANQMNGTVHAGANILRGLGGNDTYTVGANDTVDETIAGSNGTDTVRAISSYTLANGVENLFLLGATGGMTGTGNALNNGLDGTLSTAGNTLRGLAGNDSYVLGAGDVADETGGAGIDTVMSTLTQTLGAGLENLTLTGGAVVNGTGNALANRIIGNAANNTLTGGALADTLTGGLGKDIFKYNAASESTTAARDTITDFQDGAGPLDVIDLTNIRPGPTATSLLTYIGAGPVTGAFQVGVRASGADVRVLVNLDGNFATAEMEILLTGTTLASMAPGDFLL